MGSEILDIKLELNLSGLFDSSISCSFTCEKVVFNSAPVAYYYWVGDTTNHWPTHDPCGTNQPNQLASIPNPGGQVYLRGNFYQTYPTQEDRSVSEVISPNHTQPRKAGLSQR